MLVVDCVGMWGAKTSFVSARVEAGESECRSDPATPECKTRTGWLDKLIPRDCTDSPREMGGAENVT